MADPMMIMILLGLLIGLVLAMTGAGGAILSLPLLVFFLHLKIVDAAPISLIAITLSASIAALLGLRKGIVRYKAALLLAIFGVVCAPLGVYLAHQLSDTLLAIIFSIVLLVVAWRSFQKVFTPSLIIGENFDDFNQYQDTENAAPACAVNPATSKLFWTAPCTKRLILTGGFSGFLSGLLGVGGGFIIVPTLHSISNLETKTIVATSLAVIALVSMVGTLSYARHGNILWSVAIPFVCANVIGMLIGRTLNGKIPSHISLFIFATLALVIAMLMLFKTLVGLTL